MTRSVLIKQVTDLYIKSLNPKSKWYASDLADFKTVLQTKSDTQIKQQLANMKGIMGLDERTNRIIAAEERKLELYGMYNIGNMKPENSLD